MIVKLPVGSEELKGHRREREASVTIFAACGELGVFIFFRVLAHVALGLVALATDAFFLESRNARLALLIIPVFRLCTRGHLSNG